MPRPSRASCIKGLVEQARQHTTRGTGSWLSVALPHASQVLASLVKFWYSGAMRKLSLLLLMLVTLTCVVPAYGQDNALKRGVKKVGFVLKKTVMLPLYIGAGMGTSLIVWWHLGGHEGELGSVMRGGF